MTADLHGILRGTDLLSSVPAADLEAVAAGSRMRTFRRGQILFTAGDPGDTVIVRACAPWWPGRQGSAVTIFGPD
jgi:hypothetical protein